MTDIDLSELRKWAAEVCGYKRVWQVNEYVLWRGTGSPVVELQWLPDQNIAQAFEVLCEIQALHHGWRFSLVGGDAGMRGWHAELFGHEDPEQNTGQRHGSAANHSLCMALLLACREAMKGASQ